VRIGVGITTHDRQGFAVKTIKTIRDRTPEAHRIVVVDDASVFPYPGADYRFEKNVGIATAKNKCLELLDDCDHIFLFDDDCFPRVTNWWVPYVTHTEPHLMYLFDKIGGRLLSDAGVVHEDDDTHAHNHPRGCMLYVDRQVLDTVGGMDMDFPPWAGEHQAWSDRIHNAGLTQYPYMDVQGSDLLIYSADENLHVERSVPARDRARYVPLAEKLVAERKESSHYVEYRRTVPSEGK